MECQLAQGRTENKPLALGQGPLSLSLLVHALFALMFFWVASHSPAIPMPRKLTYIDVVPTAPSAQEQERIKRQIVQTERGELLAKPLPDAFLGEKNQKVDRQTISRQRNTQIAKTAQPKQAERNTQAQDTTESKQEQKAAPALSQLGVPMLPAQQNAEQAARRKMWQDEPNWATPGVAPEDYVDGMKQADRTALNTKEFVFYGYFQRIRERLDRAWVPILREKIGKLYRAGRQLASEMDYRTRVLVTLNPKGEIVRVRMVSESGTQDLDDSAVGAFNAAGPFPNPPRGLVDVRGEIEIPWEFVLKT